MPVLKRQARFGEQRSTELAKKDPHGAATPREGSAIGTQRQARCLQNKGEKRRLSYQVQRRAELVMLLLPRLVPIVGGARSIHSLAHIMRIIQKYPRRGGLFQGRGNKTPVGCAGRNSRGGSWGPPPAWLSPGVGAYPLPPRESPKLSTWRQLLGALGGAALPSFAAHHSPPH